jgi:hypothetical protein
MFSLFAAPSATSNGGDRWSSRLLARCRGSTGSSHAEMPSRQVGTARGSTSVGTDEI